MKKNKNFSDKLSDIPLIEKLGFTKLWIITSTTLVIFVLIFFAALQIFNRDSYNKLYSTVLQDRYSNYIELENIINKAEAGIIPDAEEIKKKLNEAFSSPQIADVRIFKVEKNLTVENGEASKEVVNTIIADTVPIEVSPVIEDNLTRLPDSDINEYKILKFYDTKKEVKTIIIPNKGKYRICLIYEKDQFADKILKDMEKNTNTGIAILMVATLIFSSVLTKTVTTPLNKIKNGFSKVINEGNLKVKIEDYAGCYEFNEFIGAYNRMIDTMQALYSSLENEVAIRTKDLKNANVELKNTQAMMIHSEKMKSLGELVAGIMHEINNPINFIYGNMVHLNNYSTDLINIIDEYEKVENSLPPEAKETIQSLKKNIDYEFLKTDLPDLIKSCKEGADRAKNIIQDLKSFSRMEEVSAHKVDLAHELDLTLNILHNKIKNKANVHKELAPELPEIEAYGGQLNQVFMNILDNAVGAIKEHGDVWIRMKQDKSGEKIHIEIEDNGEGMDEETMRKIFNPFFTTKPVGKGTGLGLSITYKIIKSHQGNISVKSKKGEGTKFLITLPVKLQPEKVEDEAGAANGQI